MINWNQLQEQLTNKKDIVIVSHRSPDGDSIGSSLAMQHLLEKLGHRAQVITPDPAPAFLNFLSGFDLILNGVEHNDEVNKKISTAQVIVALDFNSLDRLGALKEAVEMNQSAYLINIDHHQEPDDFADFQLSDTTASSTCQLVYEFMEKLDQLALLDESAGECIYTGLVTDTGSFRFSSTSEKTHQVAAFLLKIGVNTT